MQQHFFKKTDGNTIFSVRFLIDGDISANRTVEFFLSKAVAGQPVPVDIQGAEIHEGEQNARTGTNVNSNIITIDKNDDRALYDQIVSALEKSGIEVGTQQIKNAWAYGVTGMVATNENSLARFAKEMRVLGFASVVDRFCSKPVDRMPSTRQL